MKQLRRTTKKPLPFSPAALLVVLAVGAIGGYVLLHGSSAATYNHNPQGHVDSCALVGSTTVLYGWAEDPDAPAGSLPTVVVKVGASTSTVSSSVANYRDGPINSGLISQGVPTSSIYGWQLSLTGLYKGTSYIVSGTLNNYGTGVSVALPVNNTHHVDNDTSKPYFNSNDSIPDVCLATKPVAPPPTPTPTPTPTPVKTTPKPTTKPTATPVATTQPTTPGTPVLATSADATITTGTTSAKFAIPAGNAAEVYLIYGTDADTLDNTTDYLEVGSSSSASTTVTNLKAKTTYTYKIVRILDAQTSISDAKTFTTKGYNLTLHFVGGSGKPVAGITGNLGKSKATSDKNGNLTFKNVAGGKYTLNFNFNGKTYSQSVATTDTSSNSVTTLTVSHIVNLSALGNTAAVKHSSATLVVSLLLIVLVVGAIAGYYFLSRRRRDPLGAPPKRPTGLDIIDAQTHKSFAKRKPDTTPAPEHMGQSLREMVVQSMHAEAARRKAGESQAHDPKDQA